MKNVFKNLVHSIYSKTRRLYRALYRSNIQYSEYDHRAEFMRRAFFALGFNGIDGDYAEFGSHGGTTFALAHDEISRWKRKRHLWAFDSFQGLPESHGPEDFHPSWIKGKMSTSIEEFNSLCNSRGIPRDQYTIIDGFYEDSLAGNSLDDPGFPQDIALAYIDCDLYSSTKEVLDFLLPRLKHGMIIAFDDYFCFSDHTMSGERAAMLEVFTGDLPFRLLPYSQFGWHGMSFIVENVDGHSPSEKVGRSPS